MYLKSLNIQGFKSFPDKVKINFNDDITSVVGPNGSGKSNISDAIRWVLGEKSAKNLRGSKMEDIIFSGTSNRKPMSFAEVSINLDNQDGSLPINFTEITITRKLYKSGESEFKINGAICKLKDIHEIFMDTGIGRDGYAIIGQGRIDEVLNSKPEDRRILFEEATGIIKYKSRLNDANLKLEREHNNLIRVNDIISELSQHMKPLELQMKNAEIYIKYKDELKNIQINLFLLRVEEIENLIKEIEIKKNIFDEKLLEIKIDKYKIENNINDINNKVLEEESSLKINNDILINDFNYLKDLENKENIIKENIDYTIRDISRLKTEMENKIQNINRLKDEITNEKKNKELILHKIEKYEELLKNTIFETNILKDEMSEAELKQEIYNTNLIDSTKNHMNLSIQLNKFQIMYNQMEDRYSTIKLEKNICNKNLKKNIDDSISQDKKINNINIELNKLNQEKLDSNFKLNNLIANLDVINNRLNKIKINLNENKSEHKILKEINSNYEGYFKPVKTLLNEKRHNPTRFVGICGAVGELIEVESSYELALEVALMGSIQNVVTLKEDDTKNAIDYLKQTKSGRVTFLPISSMKSRKNIFDIDSILRENGVVNIAEKLIKYDIKYKNIFQNLLSNVVVVNTMENAISLRKKYSQNIKIVTLTGEVLNFGGSITGGSANNKSSNIFGNSYKIKKLEENINNYEAEVLTVDLQLRKIEEEIKYVRDKIENINNNIRIQSLELAVITENSNYVKNSISNLQEKVINFEIENNQLEKQIIKLNSQIENNKEEILKLNVVIENIQNSIKEQSININKEEKDKNNNKITEYKVEIKGLRQNILSTDKVIENINFYINKDEENIKTLLNDLQTKDNILKFKKDELENQKCNILIKKDSINILKNKINKQEEKLSSIKINLSKLQKKEKEIIVNIEIYQNKVSKLENEKNEQENNKLNYHDYVWEKYKLTYKASLEHQFNDIKILNIQDLIEKEKNIKNNIRNLGTINMSAIEDYTNLKAKYDFLYNQKYDIINAEDKLKDIIKQLRNLMTKQFQSKFKIISQNFDMVFKEIFGGGSAVLKIDKDEDYLTAGINIEIQPPGKKLSNVMLLSGGERALTAMSLLFSILLVKPSPFCVLDEIEASLDDYNVDRYIKFIKRFGKDMQFIIITHRKETMESSDNLYGVTMLEQGVSKLISVKFAEDILV